MDIEAGQFSSYSQHSVNAHASRCGAIGPNRCSACGFTGKFSQIASMIIQRQSGRVRTCPRCKTPTDLPSEFSAEEMQRVEVEEPIAKVQDKTVVVTPSTVSDSPSGKKRRAPKAGSWSP